MKNNQNQYAIPSEELRWRVVGNKDPQAFIKSGDNIALHFNQLIQSTNHNLENLESILDFGCGCGRILRGISSLTKANLVGCDIDQEAINWCQQNLPFAKFYLSQEYPSLPFKNNSFDLIYAVSVLTHLDEEHQHQWLKEWQRIVKQKGLLIVTFKGEFHLEKLEQKIKNQMEAELKKSGFFYQVTNFWNGIFPEYYQQAFHTVEYVKNTWSQYFEIIQINEPNILNQYTVLMKNR